MTYASRGNGRRGSIIRWGAAPLAVACLVTGCSKKDEAHDQVEMQGQQADRGSGDAGFSSVQKKLNEQTGSTKSWWGGSAPAQREMAPPAPSAPTVVSDAMPAAPPPPAEMPPPGIVADMAMPEPQPPAAFAGTTSVAQQPVSTFAVDVDTSSYSNMRQTILAGRRPDPSSVRVEEMVNYFRYDLPPAPEAGTPFSISTDVVRNPWNPSTVLMRIGLNGHVVPRTARPPANIVLLVDVSGSMSEDSRLPLVKRAFADMVDHLGPRDRVSIVSYASGAQVVLRPTSDRTRIKAALDTLSSGGGTNGGEGLRLAYAQARAGRIAGGINRVMVASDGDFNVGMSDTAELKRYIEGEREDGVTLTTLGVGERFNDGLMETMADAGNGSAAFLDDDLEARKVLRDELESSIHMIAKDVKAQVEFNPAAVSSYRLIGYQNRRLAERDFDNDKVDAGEIGSGHQVTALYEITPASPAVQDVAARRRYEANRVRDETSGPTEPTRTSAMPTEAMFVKLRYKLPDGKQSKLIQRVVPASALASPSAPTGDTAFAIAVAAFGQRLTGQIPATFTAQDILSLAGDQGDARRREFLDMVAQRPLLGGTPQIVTQPQMAPPADPAIFQPDVRPVEQPGQSGPLGTLAGMLALALAGIGGFVWWQRRSGATTTGGAATPPDATTGPVTNSGRIDMSLAATALRSAAAETSDEGRRSIRAFETTAGRAVEAAAGNAAIRDEVEAVVTRHAPSFLEEYIRARRRATASNAATLDSSLIRTLDTLAGRLGELMGLQSARDAEDVADNERFIDQRHGAPRDALT